MTFIRLTLTTPLTTSRKGPMDEITSLMTWPAPLLTISRTITFLQSSIKTQTRTARITFDVAVRLEPDLRMSLLLSYPMAWTEQARLKLPTTLRNRGTPQRTSPLRWTRAPKVLPMTCDRSPGTLPCEQTMVVDGLPTRLLATTIMVSMLDALAWHLLPTLSFGIKRQDLPLRNRERHPFARLMIIILPVLLSPITVSTIGSRMAVVKTKGTRTASRTNDPPSVWPTNLCRTTTNAPPTPVDGPSHPPFLIAWTKTLPTEGRYLEKERTLVRRFILDRRLEPEILRNPCSAQRSLPLDVRARAVRKSVALPRGRLVCIDRAHALDPKWSCILPMPFRSIILERPTSVTPL